jgi:hypothetical protein
MVERVKERLNRASDLYDAVFSGFQRRVLDTYRVRNILRLYFLVKVSKELETAEAFFYIKEATKLYTEVFGKGSRLLDEDPVGNIITLAQYLMETKKPTR